MEWNKLHMEILKKRKSRIVCDSDNVLTVTINSNEDHQQNSNSLEHVWFTILGRKPAIGPPTFELIETKSRCEQVCQILKQDPIFPGVLGIDGEFISGHSPWMFWPARHQTFPVAQVESCGPFLRFLQIARADGYVAIFDIMALQGMPDSVFELLNDENIIRFGFAWRSDHVAIDRLIAPANLLGLKRLCSLGQVNDVQVRWNYLASPLSAHRVAHLPFRPGGNGLVDFIRSAFEINVDKKFQGSGQFWNRPSTHFVNDEVKYAARDALLHLDLGLLFSYWGLWTHGPAKRIKFIGTGVDLTDCPEKKSVEHIDVIHVSVSDQERHIESHKSKQDVTVKELSSNHRLIIQSDISTFRKVWLDLFSNTFGYWNSYAYVYRNTRQRWYHKRYPSVAKMMLEMLERKMNSVILDKRSNIKVKRLNHSKKLNK